MTVWWPFMVQSLDVLNAMRLCENSFLKEERSCPKLISPSPYDPFRARDLNSNSLGLQSLPILRIRLRLLSFLRLK